MRRVRLVVWSAAVAVSATLLGTLVNPAVSHANAGCGLTPLAGTTSTDPATGASVTVNNWDYGALVVSQTVPPVGFSPLTATDAQLAFYGYPERPSSAVALQAWRDEFSPANYKGFRAIGASDMCVAQGAGYASVDLPDTDPNDILPDTAGEVGGTVAYRTSHNWAGIVDTGHTDYNYVYGRMNVPTHYACSAGQDGHFAWVGLGGLPDANGNWGLMQNATGRDYVDSSYPFAWWEVLSSSVNIAAVLLSHTSFPVAAGDDISHSTRWEPSYPRVAFYWHDFTQAWSTTVHVHGRSDSGSSSDWTVNGHIASYYDGKTAEGIDERPSQTGAGVAKLMRLRQHTQSHWRNTASAHGSSANQGVRYWSHKWFTMKNVKETTVLENWSNAPSTNDSFNDNWKACGPFEDLG